MGITSRGIQYPDGPGVPSRSALQTLAQTIDAALAGVIDLFGGKRTQDGTFTLAVGTANAYAVVNFPVPFSGAASVHCTIIDTAPAAAGDVKARWGSAADASGGDSTPTQFFFRGIRASGSGSIRVRWTARGPA